MKVSVDLIDVCLSCYLTDHHNRKGELLLGVMVDNTTTHAEVFSELCDQLNAADYGVPSWFDYDACREAMREECLPREGIQNVPFDNSLDMANDDDDDMMNEPCQAWFLVTYSRK